MPRIEKNLHWLMSATEEPNSLFGPLERRLFRVTAVLCGVMLLLTVVGIILWAISGILQIFSNIVVPLAVAGILALVLFPVVDTLQRRLRMARVWAVALLYVLFTLCVSGLLWITVPEIARQAGAFTDALPDMLNTLETQLTHFTPWLMPMIADRLSTLEFGTALPGMSTVGNTLQAYLGALAGIAFVPLYLFFALLSGGTLRGKVRDALSLSQSATRLNTLYVLDTFVGYVSAFFQGQLLIGFIMGAMLATGFTTIGLTLAIPIGLFLGLLNVVPYLGTIVGLLIVIPLASIQPGGGSDLVVMALAVFLFVQFLESWLLTPKIMSERSGLHPALVVLSIFFWGTALNGVVGMVLAVPLTAFIVAIWSRVWQGQVNKDGPAVT